MTSNRKGRLANGSGRGLRDSLTGLLFAPARLRRPGRGGGLPDAERRKWDHLRSYRAVLEPTEALREALWTALAVTGGNAAVGVVDDGFADRFVSSIGMRAGEESAFLRAIVRRPATELERVPPDWGLPGSVARTGLIVPLKPAGGDALGSVVVLWENRDPPRQAHAALVELARVASELLVDVREFEHARSAAVHDDLTGLYTPTFFRSALEQKVAEARRYGHLLSVALLDLDDFRDVADAVGILEADAVLGEVAARLRANVRSSDVVGRVGGDVFGVILADSDPPSARALYRRTRAVIDTPTLTGVKVSLSAGIAALRESDDAGALLDRAAVALRQAKVAGKGRSRVAEEGLSRGV